LNFFSHFLWTFWFPLLYLNFFFQLLGALFYFNLLIRTFLLYRGLFNWTFYLKFLICTFLLELFIEFRLNFFFEIFSENPLKFLGLLIGLFSKKCFSKCVERCLYSNLFRQWRQFVSLSLPDTLNHRLSDHEEVFWKYFNSRLLKKKIDFLIKFSIFDKRSHFWPNITFFNKIPIFDTKLWPKCVDQNFYFWPNCDFSTKLLFLTKIRIFDYFYLKFWIFAKNFRRYI